MKKKRLFNKQPFWLYNIIMKKFSSRKATSSKNQKVIWDPKSTTILESILTSEKLNVRNILKIINDPKQEFLIKQEIRSNGGDDRSN